MNSQTYISNSPLVDIGIFIEIGVVIIIVSLSQSTVRQRPLPLHVNLIDFGLLAFFRFSYIQSLHSVPASYPA